MGVYVFEGPDLAGKSSLARRLANGLKDRGEKVEIVKFGPPGDVKSYELFNKLVGAVSNAATMSRTGVNVIFDRLHLGELVYGPVMRDRSLLSMEQAIAIDQMLDGIKATKIFVDADVDVLLARYKERGDDYVSMSQLFTLTARYRELLGLGLPTDDIAVPSLSEFKRWERRTTEG